jgi:hypothetical protein
MLPEYRWNPIKEVVVNHAESYVQMLFLQIYNE